MTDFKGALAHLLKGGVCAWVLFYSQQASAAYVNRVTATYAHRTTLALSAGTHTVRTSSLTTGCDTVIHIINASTGVEIAHDDDGGGAPASLVTFNLPAATTVVILVRSYVPSTTGRANLNVDGSITSQVRVGGAFVTGLPTGNLRYETAMTVGGSADTYVYGFDLQSRIIMSDDDSGVGLASRMTSSSIRSVLVGAYNESFEGTTTLYANDYTNDPDEDGLGSGLEAELGTCPGTCPNIANGFDTDRDGLDDAAEVFGVDDASFPQYLQRWGALPLHKDVFLEIDWDSTIPSHTQPVTAADIERLQANWYAAGSAADLKNPDTAGGIRIHADIGPNAAAPPQTRSGNWGGSNQANNTDYVAAAWDPANFAVVRRGIFHHAQIAKDYYGQSDGVPSWRLGWGGSTTPEGVFVTNMHTLAHELGHNLGLDHHGVDSWGIANCKPHYVSIMNYSWGGDTPFSQGQNSSIVLNPAQLSELNTFSPSLPEPTYMSHARNARSGRMVDWNLDGTYVDGPGIFGFVRGTANWSWVDGCSAFQYGLKTLQQGTGIIAPDTPKMARIGSRLFMFTITQAGALQYRSGTISGADNTGSCPLGTPDCMTWSGATNSGIATTVTSVSAAPWQGGILLAYRRSGSLYASFATANASGVLSFSAPQSIAAVNAPPELTIMNVDSSIFGQSEVAAVFAASAGVYRMFTANSPTGTWMARSNVTRTDGTVLTGPLVPTVISWPNRGGVDHSAIAKSCGTFNDTSNNVRFYCYDKATNRWADLSATLYGTGPIEKSTVKTALAYHVTRSDLGTPLENDPTRGSFWQVTIPTTDARPRLRVTNAVSASNPPGVAAMTMADGALYWDPWTTLMAFTNVGLYEDEAMSAMKGAMVVNQVDKNNVATQTLFFEPFADGTEVASFKDGNDFQVMERGICRSLHPGDEPVSCGPPNEWGY